MKLTPYHPIMRGNSAYFPIDYHKDGSGEQQLDGYVYDFVLENRGLVAFPTSIPADTTAATTSSINSLCSTEEEIEVLYAATYGHNETRGCFAHAYFGSDAVVQDLRRHPAYSTGTITLDKYTFLREKEGECRVIGLYFMSNSILHSDMDLLTSPVGSLISV